MSQKCYNFVAKFMNNANMEENKSDLIEGLKEYLDNASEEELAELEKYNRFGPVVNISEYYSRANNMDMEQRREAFKLAFEWIRNIPLCDCDIDLATAYAEGVICGWNNPNWTSVKDKQSPKTTDWAKPNYFLGSTEEGGIHKMYRMGDPTICKDFENEQLYLHVTHWKPIVPPRKEE